MPPVLGYIKEQATYRFFERPHTFLRTIFPATRTKLPSGRCSHPLITEVLCGVLAQDIQFCLNGW